MNKLRLKLVGLIVLLMVGGSVCAEPGRFGGGFFGSGKASTMAGNDAPRKELMRQRRAEKAAGRPVDQRSEYAGKELNKDVDRMDRTPRKNRLTPDERRALRRQIHEASNELHAPSR